jgi:hypothetical protein
VGILKEILEQPEYIINRNIVRNQSVATDIKIE